MAPPPLAATVNKEALAVSSPAAATAGLLAGNGLADGGCAAAVASFLSQEALLATRATCAEVLCGVMQRLPPAGEDREGHNPDGGAAGTRTAPGVVHDRVRVRLWLRRLEMLTAGFPDETVFETGVRTFVDDALRRRMEAEVAAAKGLMEEEVREAKNNMLQTVQAITDEVDRRVYSKVTLLQEEFDRRAAEQVRILHEAVERRVTEQTMALRAEVERRSDVVRAAVEERARVQEAAARCLQEEVARIRQELETRIGEQEEAALRLAQELAEVRASFHELVFVRQALEQRVLEQEDAANRLRTELANFHAASAGDTVALLRDDGVEGRRHLSRWLCLPFCRVLQ